MWGYIQSDGTSAVLLPETLVDHFLVGVVARVCAWCGIVPFTHWVSSSWLSLGQKKCKCALFCSLCSVAYLWCVTPSRVTLALFWGCSSFPLLSYMSPDVASGKEMSDSFEGATGSGKQEGKSSKKHKKSTRARSRQEKSNRPKLTILNASTTCWRATLGFLRLCQE